MESAIRRTCDQLRKQKNDEAFMSWKTDYSTWNRILKFYQATFFTKNEYYVTEHIQREKIGSNITDLLDGRKSDRVVHESIYAMEKNKLIQTRILLGTMRDLSKHQKYDHSQKDSLRRHKQCYVFTPIHKLFSLRLSVHVENGERVHMVRITILKNDHISTDFYYAELLHNTMYKLVELTAATFE
jgi:hypothetical protein